MKEKLSKAEKEKKKKKKLAWKVRLQPSGGVASGGAGSGLKKKPGKKAGPKNARRAPAQGVKEEMEEEEEEENQQRQRTKSGGALEKDLDAIAEAENGSMVTPPLQKRRGGRKRKSQPEISESSPEVTPPKTPILERFQVTDWGTKTNEIVVFSGDGAEMKEEPDVEKYQAKR